MLILDPKNTEIYMVGHSDFKIQNSYVMDINSIEYKDLIDFIKDKFKKQIKRVIMTGDYEIICTEFEFRFDFTFYTSRQAMPVTLILTRKTIDKNKYAYRVYGLLDGKVPIVAIDGNLENEKDADKNNPICTHRRKDGHLAFKAIGNSQMRCEKCRKVFDMDNDIPFLPLYEEIWEDEQMKAVYDILDINKLKLKVVQVKRDNNFILRIYIDSNDKDIKEKILNLLSYMQEKYDNYGMCYDFDKEASMYNIAIYIQIQDVEFFKGIVEDILYNTEDKTTRIYNGVSTYLDGLKNNDSYISYETYAYINHFFNFETSEKLDYTYRDIYGDMENAEIRKSIDRIRVHTKFEAMHLLRQVTSYFKSVIDYCAKNNQSAFVISDTIPEFRRLIRSVKVEFYPKKVDGDESTYVDIDISIGSDFIIGRRFNKDYGKVEDAPMYKLILSDILK